MNIVGQQMKRVDAYGKVTEEARYTADLESRDIPHGRVVHSTTANGRIRSFDLTEAYKVPGVAKIVTRFDVPDCRFPTTGHPWSIETKHQDICDRKLLNERIRLYGDDTAAIMVEDEVAASQAARLVKVGYEEYEPIVTVKAAMAEGASPLHPDLRKDNVIVHSHMTVGASGFTHKEGLKKAEETYEQEQIVATETEYDAPRIPHCHIQLPVSRAYVDASGRITVIASTQTPRIVRRYTAQALGVPIGGVRIIKPYIGDGFGNKRDVLYEPPNALLSLSVGGRPVRLEISREGTISGTRIRHAIKGLCKAVLTEEGCVLARQLDAYANSEGYASHGRAICANCDNMFKDLYRDELGAEIDYSTVYTSSPTAGAMRGYGIPQAAWFTGCLADDMAWAIGMDPCEFRIKSCVGDGFVDPASGITFYPHGLKKCIEAGKEHIRWDEEWNAYRNQTGPVRKDVDMAIFYYKTGAHPISLEIASARVVSNQDGSIRLCMGATEIGQGAGTVFTQMASETTGISYDQVYIVSTQDTDTTPFDTGVYASRQTYVSGMALKKCAEEPRYKILDYAAYMLSHDITDLSKTVYTQIVKDAGCRLREALGLHKDEKVTEDMLDTVDSKVVVCGGAPELFDVGVVADTVFYPLECSVHITAEVTNQCKQNILSSGCCFVEIEVDIPLSLVTITDIINVHDSGVLINPQAARVQVRGGMSMGLGYGLSEELLVDEKTGKPLDNNLLDYKIPIAMDIPDLNVEFIQLEDPAGPYGNESLGEPPAIPVAPAIWSTILNATGVHMDVNPMMAQRLIEKFKEKDLV